MIDPAAAPLATGRACAPEQEEPAAAPHMSGGTYYQILGVTPNASSDEIKNSYRKLALKWHPERAATGTKLDNEAKFDAISEAYDVLSIPARRAIFDQYGERGLKEGVPDGNGGINGGSYRFKSNSREIFFAFFGTSSPFSDIMGTIGDDVSPDLYGELTGMQLPAKPQKPPAKQLPLMITLEELYNGATKKVTYARRVLKPDGATAAEQNEQHIRIAPGIDESTVFTIPGAGDEGVDVQASDLEVTLQLHPSAPWAKKGSTLYFSADLALVDALCGSIVEVPTLDGRVLSVPVTQIVAPGATKVVPGEGMPLPSTPGQKGDLVIEFNIKFPKTLTPTQKEVIKKTLV